MSRLFAVGMKREVFVTDDSSTCKGKLSFTVILYVLVLESLLSCLNKSRVPISGIEVVYVYVCI
jgi:hypothetical protein